MRLRVYLPESTFDWQSPAASFRVGRGDTCALVFTGESAKYASWEHAEFSMRDGVAYVTDLGSSNGTYVDGVRISEAAALWIGATVQIGGKGPRLELLELTAAAPRPLPVGNAGIPPAQPRSVGVPPAQPIVVASQQPTRTRRKLAPQYLALLATTGILVIASVFLASRATNRDGPSADASVARDPSHSPTKTSGNRRQKTTDSPNVVAPDPPPDPVTPQPEPPPVSAPADPWKVAKEQGLPAYRLIVVEDPQTQTAWPLAGAAIVAPQALLTTADVGVQLARFLARDFHVKVVRDSQDAGTPVASVRIHDGFQNAEPDQQLYFDLALVSTTERLTDVATLASAAELAAIEHGQPLACAAIHHAGEPIDRFQQLQPEWQTAKVFNLTALSSDAGAPRVLHLRGALGDKSPGSPIFNDRGHLVAIYCEAAPNSGGPPDRALHYAKPIEPQLIELGLSQADNTIWVAPVIPPQSSSKEEPRK